MLDRVFKEFNLSNLAIARHLFYYYEHMQGNEEKANEIARELLVHDFVEIDRHIDQDDKDFMEYLIDEES